MATPQNPQQITEAVQKHHEETQALRLRMDDDFRRWWVQEPYNTNSDGGDAFRSYTSNRAKTFADKLIVTLSDAEIHIRCPYGEIADDDFIQRCNDKERFARGILNRADARMRALLNQPLQNDTAWHASCRGWMAVRTLFVKDERGQTDIDLTSWDVRNTYWSMGHNGLDWACYKVERTAAQVEAEYGVRPLNRSDSDRVEVYDFYDRAFNSVVVDNEFIKPPTPHAGVLIDRVPIMMGVVGPSPLIQARGTTTTNQFGGSDSVGNLVKDYGESIWATDRQTFDYENEILSVYLEHVAKGREQGYVLKSPNAEKGLDENPDETSTVIQLDVNEDLQPIPRPDLTKDTAQLAALVSGEAQKGSLPDSAFGNAPFALSGIAIDILNTTQLSQLRPRLRAMEGLYEEIVNFLVDIYVSGAFAPMEVNGFTENKQYFSDTIVPQTLTGLPPLQVEMVAQLPQDDIAKLQFAQMARDGVIPLLSDQWLRENQLGIKDERAEEDRVYQQMAQRASPIALDLTLMNAAAAREDNDLAQTYFIDLIIKRMMQQGQLQALFASGIMPPGGPGGGGPGGQGGSPEQGRGNEPRGGTTLRPPQQPDQREVQGPSRNLRPDL